MRCLTPILLLTLTACTHANFWPNAAAIPYHAPTQPEQIEILLDLPERPYTELGSVEVTGSSFNLFEQMIERHKKEAARHGADAVVLYQGIDSHGISMVSDEANQHAHSSKAILIRYQDEAP